MTQHIHHVRGRLRIRMRRLKNDPELAETLVAKVKRLAGVKSATVNVVTGSLLVYYDPAQTHVSAVMPEIEALLPSVETPSAAPLRFAEPRTARVEEKLAEAVFWCALEKAVERAAPLLISALL